MVEKQLAQVAFDKASASNTPLLAQPYPNPSGDHHQVKSVTLRSGTSYEGPKGKEVEEKLDEGVEVDGENELRETQPKEKKMRVKKTREEVELITLPHQVNVILLKTMPRKYLDPGSFTLLVRIGDLNPMGALADLGAGVSLMPLCVAKQLTFELVPTRKIIQLANRSIRVPDGQLVDIPIRVGHLIVPFDFIVIDMEPDPVTPLILGREALKTLGAVINCKDNTITIEVASEAVVFQFSKHLRRPMVEKGDVCQLQVIEDGLGAIGGEALDEDGTGLDIVKEQVFA